MFGRPGGGITSPGPVRARLSWCPAPFDLVIFDCDGVLVDSEIISASTLADNLTRIGFPVDLDYVNENYLGRSFNVIKADYLCRAGRPLTARIRRRLVLRPVRRLSARPAADRRRRRCPEAAGDPQMRRLFERPSAPCALFGGYRSCFPVRS